MIDYHKILGLRSDASLDDIKRAYRKLAFKYHPDKNDSPDAAEKFVEVSEAYEYLIDPKRRKLYISDSTKEAFYKKKEDAYKEWVGKERSRVRHRASMNAKSPYEEFESNMLAKAAGCADSLLNYFMMFIGVFVILSAWYLVVFPDEAGDEVNYGNVISLTILGLLFVIAALKIDFLSGES